MFNECLDIGWKTAHFCILNFSFKNDFVWEEISNIRHSISSPDETPRSSSKILRYASYFQLSSRCFIWWWNTASHVWYITYTTDPLKGFWLKIYHRTANPQNISFKWLRRFNLKTKWNAAKLDLELKFSKMDKFMTIVIIYSVT